MRTISTSSLAAAAMCTIALAASASAQTYKTQKFNIGGEGNFDYLTADAASGRVFVSRGTHVMVVDGATGKVLGDIRDTPRVHGIALAPKQSLGFTTNAGDSTATMFDWKTLEVKKKIKAGHGGLDGIMYDDATGMILTIDHEKPGTAVVIDPSKGEVVASITLNGNSPEGGVSNGKDRIFINLEDKNAIDVIDSKTWKVVATWKIDRCEEPTGIAMDRSANRIFSGCSGTSVVVDASTGKIVAQIKNGQGVDALGWDQSQKLMYIPAGGDGNVTVVHEDSPDKYTVVETVPTMKGARTIAVDDAKHVAYVFTPERGPSTPSATPGGRATPGPITRAWLIQIKK
jgi:DNA-binding beta-propeller fold protein YncE